MLHNASTILEQGSPIWVIPFSQLSGLVGEFSLESVKFRHVDEDLGQAAVHVFITIKGTLVNRSPTSNIIPMAHKLVRMPRGSWRLYLVREKVPEQGMTHAKYPLVHKTEQAYTAP